MTESQCVHLWNRCYHCGMNPILGSCFRCNTCPLGPDIDLCESCYEGLLKGEVPHPYDSEGSYSTSHRFSQTEGSSPEEFVRWLDVAPLRHPAPSVPDGFLVRPEFRYGRESSFGGYGFVVQHENAVFLLTALHVMDEVIKKKGLDTTARNASYSGRELQAVVTSVQLYDVLKRQWALYELGTAGPMVVLPNSRTADEEPFAFRDIAAFRMTHAQLAKAVYSLAPRPLALRDPEAGEPVWLAAAMPDGSRTRQAVCVESTPRGLIFRYVDTKGIAKHSSGAPIVDRDGAVVGINTGLGRLEQYEFGHANPVSSIRTHLATATIVATAAIAAAGGM